MKKLFFLIGLFLSTIVWGQSKLLSADGYLDVRQGKIVKPGNLLIEGDRIVAINPENLPSEVERVDLKGKILLPGLMDMHTHLETYFDGSFDDLITKENASMAAIMGMKNAEKTLMAGFTTVRNVGQVHYSKELIVVALSEASDKGLIAAPRIVAAGHMISITGGHGDLSMGFKEGLFDLGIEHGIVSGPYQAMEAVRYQIKHGAQVIKMHATAGVLSMEETIGAQQLSDEEMKAVVEEAHRHGIKVAAHAHGAEGIRAAVRAGVASIEHGSFIDDEAMALMIEKGVYLVPTTGLIELMKAQIPNMDPLLAKKTMTVDSFAVANVKKAIKKKVKIAMGTDAPLIPHGENYREIYALVDRGMTEKEALQAATINSADLLGKTDRGEIKKGLLADLIAVDQNPLEEIETLSEVKFVMKGGQIYKHE